VGLVGSQNGKRLIFSQNAPTEAKDKILWMPLDSSNNPINGLIYWWNGSTWVMGASRPSVLVNSSRTLTLDDAGEHLYATASLTLTIPQSTFVVDQEIEVAADEGTITIAVSGSVTINASTTSFAVNAGKIAVIKFRSPNNARIWGGT
jgi:hypothetical protein